VPNDARRIHKKPVARLGGLAIFTGFWFLCCSEFKYISQYEGNCSLKTAFRNAYRRFYYSCRWYVDDIKQLGPRLKLVFK